jgi:hypothetical protein
MKRRLAAAAVAVVGVFVIGFWAGRWQLRVVQAQSPLPPKVWHVPKSWGTFKAVYHDQLLFEDADGTIRSVYPNATDVVFTIRRR